MGTGTIAVREVVLFFIILVLIRVTVPQVPQATAACLVPPPQVAMSTALHRPELSVRDNVDENKDRRMTEGRWHTLWTRADPSETDCPRWIPGEKESQRCSLSMAPAI